MDIDGNAERVAMAATAFPPTRSIISTLSGSSIRHRTASFVATYKNGYRSFSSVSSDDDASQNNNNNNQLRIAVVGGGAAGMTAALHLSPLVASGLVHGPIDVYESTIVKKRYKTEHRNSGHTEHGDLGGKQLYPGSGALGRNIGVGIWSTAWSPFLKSLQLGISTPDTDGDDDDSTSTILNRQKNRQSYQTLLQDLEACGSYVEDVGYRTPNGSWLVKSELNAKPFGINDLLSGTKCNLSSGDIDAPKITDNVDPALLFVREKDLLSCLRNAIKIEQRLGTVKYHSGVRVDGIDNVNGDLGSLVLQSTTDDDSENNRPSLSPQYHLIIAADGLYSSLRSRFAGHDSPHVTGGMLLAKPKNDFEYEYDHTKGQRQATEVEDREYIVLRGNAPKLESTEEDGSGSFQTWGDERSMRFAAVPFRHETEDLEDDEDDTSNNTGHYSTSQSFLSKKQDEEVWFATISDPAFIDTYKANTANASDAKERKQMLLDAFGSWHKPVKTLIETTPADQIMFETAIAHRHNASPVFDVARILEFELWQQQRELNVNNPARINGEGPILVFTGDAMMTVDPVLAQGFTMAMESGASIVQSIERILATTPEYKPDLLRKELTRRHYNRQRRLLQLLRSTELVQRLAQPQGIGAVFATWIIRPMVKLCPEGLKKRVFDYMIKYSLGLNSGEEQDRY